MASPSAHADAASRTIPQHSSTSAAATTAPPADDTQRRPADPIQLSAADCSVGDDSGAVASSVAFGVAASTSAEHIPSSSSSQHPPPPPPPPPFEPLFALVTNATTGATVHPRIHYLFSDDDASIPTDTITTTTQDDDDNQHRSLVVDLAPTPAHDAWAVSCASSLGPEFAVTAAALSKQQSDGNSSSSSNAAGGGSSGATATLMLHVEGVSRDPVDLRSSAEAVGSAGSLRSSTGSGGAAREDLEALADDFQRRMGILKSVVGEGEKRRAVVGHQHRDDDDAGAAAAAAAAGSHEIHDPGTLRSGTASQSHDASTNT